MVKINTIKQANEAFAKERHSDLVAVFMGATSGIGASTLNALAPLLQSGTVFIAGRSDSRFAAQRTSLEKLNPNLKILFFECDVSLLSNIDAFAKFISSSTSKIDILYMSPGLLPLAGPKYTSENLELYSALSYYSRLALLTNLLPLLRQSPHPRFLSVLAGGKESTLVETDLGLTHSWSPLTAMNQAATMTTLAFDHLAAQAENKNITFVHAFPGFVKTEIGARMEAPEGAGVVRRVWTVVLRGVTAALMWLFGMGLEEAGERMVYYLVDSGLGERKGLVLVDDKSEVVEGGKVLERYRAEGWGEKVWEFTNGVLGRH